VGYCYALGHDKKTALQELDLTISRGERIALLGANGSGKSTLLRLLAALAFPSHGEVLYEGQALTEKYLSDVRNAIAFRRSVQILFQESEVQLFNPTVADEVAFGPLQMDLAAGEVKERVAKALAMLGLEHLRARSPHRLSGGEKKRVALAAVLSIGAGVLLLDEPTASLDPRTQSGILDFLDALPPECTVVTATHDVHLLGALARRSLVFDQGRLIADAPTEAVLEDKALLTRANLIFSHRHRHGGAPHAHAFLPDHEHKSV
jgi:cobalt/nickel transport system ATP-binding protein